jgi:GDPmannose 4,6-dehydratase
MAKSALIAGVSGQDGSYLSELLLSKGYEVHGLVRRLGTANTEKLANVKDKIQFVEGDLLDQTSLEKAIESAKPTEVYNLASPSFIGSSFKQPLLTGEIAGLGALRLIEAIRKHAPDARLYQACSSEMFGKTRTEPQDETTPFRPGSPYGVAKVYAYWTGVNYREAYNAFISNGITYNHESPRRGQEFVTRKITLGVARIASGLQKKIDLGNIDAKRDWGYAPEYVEAMWRILQHKEGDDFVIATGEVHTVREWIEAACEAAGIDDPMRTYGQRTSRTCEATLRRLRKSSGGRRRRSSSSS